MIHIDSTLTVPVFGEIDAEILIDTKKGIFQLGVPDVGICHQETGLPQFDLKELLLQIYSEQGGLTVYDGDDTPQWDKTVFDKFHLTAQEAENNLSIEAWVSKVTHNGRWLKVDTDAVPLPTIIVNVPKGEEPATFTDKDFLFTSCDEFESNRRKVAELFAL